ncbi:MAG: recombinase family protein [Pseudoruegeria sp.]
MKFGYARVSTSDQDTSLQRDALKAAGCEQITVDKVSGAAKKRPKLDKLVKSLNEGDVLTVWRLDRVGRSLPHLLTFVQDLQDRGIGFQSLHETIDTTSVNDKLMFHTWQCLPAASINA